MAKIYGVKRFKNEKISSIQRTVEILPKTGTNIIKFTNNEELLSKVVIPGSGNSISRWIKNIVTNYKKTKPKNICINCKEDYDYVYYKRFENPKNGWSRGENLNIKY